jgi:acyl-coenzyme A synthetase/AMP-(fatty) acid ligase
VEVIVMGTKAGCIPFSELLEDDGTQVPDILVGPNDLALIMATSGTTGKSKGAAHTHQSFMRIIKTLAALPWFEAKPNLVASRGTHLSGILFPLSTFVSGKTALVMAIISKANLLTGVDKYKPGLVWGFPPFLLTLVNDPDAVNYDVSSIEVCLTGGAPVTPTIETTLMKLPNVKSVINVSK